MHFLLESWRASHIQGSQSTGSSLMSPKHVEAEAGSLPQACTLAYALRKWRMLLDHGNCP